MSFNIFKRKKKENSNNTSLNVQDSSQNESSKLKKVKNVNQRSATIDFIQASKEFEISRIDMVERSRVIAWRVAIGACIVALASVGAITAMLPLKEVRPYVIRVDNNTGATDVVTMIDNQSSSYPEEVGKYFSALYVKNLESYDWYTIKSQVDSVLHMSDPAMQNRIKNIFSLSSAPHNLYGDKNRIEVKVTSVSFVDSNIVQVRFTKTLVPTNGGTYNQEKDVIDGVIQEKKYIATLGYDYTNVPTVDDVRRINPLGFTVKSYRTDEDGEL